MASSTRIDINLLSLGNEGKTWTLYSGAPDARVIDEVDFTQLNANRPGLASILKISGKSYVDLHGLKVGQGRECSVDINNGSTAVFSDCEFGSSELSGHQVFSVKGFSTAVISGNLKGRGKRFKADILIDNWSDQDYRGSRVNLTHARHEDGKPINVVLRYGASQVALGENAKVLIKESIGLTVYWWAKWLVRKILFIRKGERGPSWI